MKTAISLPDSLFEAAERLAKRMGVSRSELFQRAVQMFLREHEDEGVTEALDQVYSHGSEEAHLDPLLEQLQLASLSKDEW
jgi:metal-responsive CopG/Arc/MetJ family transcriptional regulator